MKYEKNIKLAKLDEKEFKYLLANRETYINSGDDSLTASTSEMEKLANQITLVEEVFYVKKRETRDENTILTISPKNSRNIPLHRPGEYLILSTSNKLFILLSEFL